MASRSSTHGRRNLCTALGLASLSLFAWVQGCSWLAPLSSRRPGGQSPQQVPVEPWSHKVRTMASPRGGQRSVAARARGGGEPGVEAGFTQRLVGLVLLTLRVTIALNMLGWCRIMCRHNPKLSVSASALHACAGLALLILRKWPPLVLKTELAALSWLLRCTVLAGCPHWYRPFATRQVACGIQRYLGSLLVFVAVNLLAHAVPSGLKMSSGLVPIWLQFLDENKDGKITSLEFEKQVWSSASKVLSAFAWYILGRMILRLKNPSPKDVDYEEPLDPDEAVKGTNLLWDPVMRFIIMKDTTKQRQNWVMLADKMIGVAIYVVITSACLNVVGLRLETVLAIGGVSGLAVGLAAKTLAQNLISGILIYTNKSIQPGLEMELMNRGLSGIVDNVGWFNTEISLYDGVIVRVPNAEVFEGVVAYRTKKRVRVCDEEFVVQLVDQAKLRDLVSSIQAMLLSDTNLMQAEQIVRLKARYKGRVYAYPPQCVFAGWSDHGAKLRLRAYLSGNLKGDDFLEAQSKLLLAVNEQISSQGGMVGMRFLQPTTSFAGKSESRALPASLPAKDSALEALAAASALAPASADLPIEGP
ncbi:unnamed protein product [Polarella glacialis]|uniref:Mechanosensitive ion channel MscS domain-containing protein n=2 Tax=Polarella glacialis TaxID=89957 RepID=A0A813EUM0_POLGL|nr:unnamed protein product [Polarella glacialis]